MTEYRADTLSRLHGATPVLRSEDYQTELLEMSHRAFDQVEAVVGEQI